MVPKSNTPLNLAIGINIILPQRQWFLSAADVVNLANIDL